MPNEVVVALKGDGAAPWVTIHGEEVADAERLVEDSLKGSLFQTTAEAATLLSGAVRVANGFDPNAPAEQPASKPPYQPRQQVQQNSSFNGTPHPEGKICPLCKAGLVGKQPKVKRMWTCPNQKQQGDGHYVEWIND